MFSWINIVSLNTFINYGTFELIISIETQIHFLTKQIFVYLFVVITACIINWLHKYQYLGKISACYFD